MVISMSTEGIDEAMFVALQRGLFDAAVATARAGCDPCADWERFVEVLWTELAPAVGWEPLPWPEGLSAPDWLTRAAGGPPPQPSGPRLEP